MTPSCLICQRVAMARTGHNPYLIHEFEHSLFVVGDHQFFRGYSLLLLKVHLRELHDLPPSVQPAFYHELMLATEAIVRCFKPDKLNHLALGNQEPHVHWHIMPRYANDGYYGLNPLLAAPQFMNARITDDEARSLAATIRRHLILPETQPQTR